MGERVYLSLGGNIGEPFRAFADALRLIDADPSTSVVRVSSVYRTPPWGKLDQPHFLNAAAAIDTSLGPRAFLDLCLASERSLKRVRGERWGPRLIDLDVLLFGDRTIEQPGLEIPHPRMLDRAFVLVPLAEIAPDVSVRGEPISLHSSRVERTGIERLDLPENWWA